MAMRAEMFDVSQRVELVRRGVLLLRMTGPPPAPAAEGLDTTAATVRAFLRSVSIQSLI
eukprot:COSAG05_NODE_1080_length_5950_cov_1.563323_3_plen_59_part_00